MRIDTERAPVYIVNFTQKTANERAQDLCSTLALTKEEKRALAFQLVEGYVKTIEEVFSADPVEELVSRALADSGGGDAQRDSRAPARGTWRRKIHAQQTTRFDPKLLLI